MRTLRRPLYAHQRQRRLADSDTQIDHRALHCGDSKCAIFYDSERARHGLAFALQVFNKFEFVVRTHKGARRVSAVVAPGSPKADRGGCTHRSELARSWPYFSRNAPEPFMLAQP